MKIKFWGVRGSCPTPITKQRLQSKISAVVQRIEKKDLETPESREKFLSSLPPELFGTVGGNTTCIEIRLEDNTVIILDAGSGIREFAADIKRKREKITNYHMFFTHFHWDHIQGLPFFHPAYEKNIKMYFYSPVKNFEEHLKGQMRNPYFPVTMDAMGSEFSFNVLDDFPVTIGAAKVFYRMVKHPGSCISYKITEGDKSIIFSTDTELTEKDFTRNEENTAFYQNADIIILDSQYTLDEAIEKYDWGHSSYSLAVDFANEWGIKNLILFHHEPMYDDKKMYSILNSSRWYLSHLGNEKLKIYLAEEGFELLI